MAETTKPKTPDTSTIISELIKELDGQPQQRQPQQPYIKIIEQPAKKMRIRYKSSGHSGTLYSEKRTDDGDARSHPKIQVVGYQGPVRILVSVVEENEPYRQHPHHLVSKGREDGIYVKTVDAPDMTCEIKNVGLARVKREDVKSSLEKRKAMSVDPFGQGFDHAAPARNMDYSLHAVRLCFCAYARVDGEFAPLGRPVVSEVIRCSKAHSDLKIVDASDDWATAGGRKKIILLCEKLGKDKIEVRFVRKGGEVVANVPPAEIHVHHLTAISFETPDVTHDIVEPAVCSMFLYNPSTGEKSNPVTFTFHPAQQGATMPPPPVKATTKRGRPAKDNGDDPSTGIVTLPPKYSVPAANGGDNTDGPALAQTLAPPTLLGQWHQEAVDGLGPMSPVSPREATGQRCGLDQTVLEEIANLSVGPPAAGTAASDSGTSSPVDILNEAVSTIGIDQGIYTRLSQQQQEYVL